MIQINNLLPDWISKQASLGGNIKIDGKLTNENYFWYLLTVCCPLIFESYAIILHPFWINQKVKNIIDNGRELNKERIDESDFKRTSWKQFFSLYNIDFDIHAAKKNFEDLSKKLSGNNFPPYLWFPAEGDCESQELIFIRDILRNLYGDISVNYYYCFLKSTKWEDEIIYRGSLSEFESLWVKKEIRNNPTAIYNDTKQFCIVTDYDLKCTYVGGETKFIESIVSNKEFEIFKLSPVFKEMS